MKTDVVPELIEPCLQLQLYFYNIIPAIQRFLIVRFRDIYEDLVEANTRAMLADAKFYQVSLQIHSRKLCKRTLGKFNQLSKKNI